MTGTDHGELGNIILASIGLAFGVRALYYAFKGVWRPGGIGSHREPVKAEWYLRVFTLIGGVWAIYVAVYFLRK